MSVKTIANRYGRALADVVMAKGEQDKIKEELRAFVSMLMESSDLREVFSNPTISLQQQRAVLDAIISRAKPSQTTINFLQVLLSKYRMQYLDEIFLAFNRILDERLNVINAEVTTAAPLSAEQQNLLGQQLRKLTGKEVRLKFSTDASLIGGVVTTIGSKVYDGSIRNQLQMLRTQLTASH